ncbi:MAG: ABC transporter [Pseudomonadota bacterium]|nr:ABC transporter [Pseudomonadota bacterium]
MKTHVNTFFQGPMAKQAIIVPVLIMLIFSVFNLTAPMDPARTVQSVTLGIVNQDEGLQMPPVKVSERMLQGLSGQMPFATQSFDDSDAAVAALEAGDISVLLVFPTDFSAKAFRGDQASFEIVTSPAVTVAEFQMAQQLERMLPAAMSAGVASLRLAMEKGQMPTGAMPVTAEVSSIAEVGPMAKLQAPFVMLFTTWLAGFVGALMMTLATRGRADRGTVALTRTLIPVLVTGFASFCLSLIVGATAGWETFLPAWIVVWPTTLALTWLFVGLLSLLGLWMIAVILPLVFYQSAIGGVMAPAAAAPDWLTAITGWAGLDQIGAAYRGAVHGVGMSYPVVLVASIAILGLALIWIRATLPARAGASGAATTV